MAAIDGLVPQRQAPPPPRPSTSSNKSLSLQLTAGSAPHSAIASTGSSAAPKVERDSAPAPPRVPPSKKGPPPPQKPSRQNNHRSSPHDTLRSNHSDIAHQHSHSSSSSKSSGSRSHHHYDSEYTSNRSTFKGVFSNIVNSMSGNVSSSCRLTNPGRFYSRHYADWTRSFFLLIDLLSSDKKMEISSPYNPVHLTHVGYNLDTGEFTVSARALSGSFFCIVYWLNRIVAPSGCCEHNPHNDKRDRRNGHRNSTKI